MILEFKVANYRSFCEEQTISFVADKSKRLPENLIESNGYRLTKAIGLFGANASGKSNLCKAISGFRDLVSDSNTPHILQKIVLDQPHLLRPTCVNEPSCFEITVLIQDTVFRFGFHIHKNTVIKEWLYLRRHEQQDEELVYIRTTEDGIVKIEMDWTGEDKLEDISGSMLSNQLFINWGIQRSGIRFSALEKYLFFEVWNFDMSRPFENVLENTIDKLFHNKHLLR